MSELPEKHFSNLGLGKNSWWFEKPAGGSV
jgi:hypothetical protein